MKRFSFFARKRNRAGTGKDARPAPETPAAGGSPASAVGLPMPAAGVEAEIRGFRPGSDGEHGLQCRYGSEGRADGFYTRQVLDYLSPTMQEFIGRQEFLFVATSDRHGECDCTSKFGQPGFIRVLADKYLMYPEYRGNGVFASLGNITENPHIAMLIVDFYRDTVGLHVNGKARIVENEELLAYREELPENVRAECAREGKKRPERWIMVEVEEAYIQCSKHIPLLKKLDKRVDWGTDDTAAKGGDYFRLQQIPLYDRVGGDKAMDLLLDAFYRRVLPDDLVGCYFLAVDPDTRHRRFKAFLAHIFGGPDPETGMDLHESYVRLTKELGLTDTHIDRMMDHFRASVREMHMPETETDRLCEYLESLRGEVFTES